MMWFILALLSALNRSVSTILSKKVLQKEHALEFSATRGIYVVFILLFLIPIIDFNITFPVILLIYAISIAATAAMLYVVKAIRHMEISIVSPLTNLSPLFLLIIAYFILGEKVTPIQLLGILLLLAGAYLLESKLDTKDIFYPIKIFIKSKYIHYLLFGLIVFSFTATMDRFVIINYVTPLTYLFFIWMFVALNFFILEAVQYGMKEICKDVIANPITMMLIAIATVLTVFFQYTAISIQNVGLVIPIKRMSTLFETMIGGEAFHEDGLLYKSIACIVMIIGAALLAMF